MSGEYTSMRVGKQAREVAEIIADATGQTLTAVLTDALLAYADPEKIADTLDAKKRRAANAIAKATGAE